LQRRIGVLAAELNQKSATENAATQSYIRAASILGQIRGAIYATNSKIKSDERQIARVNRDLGKIAVASYVNGAQGGQTDALNAVGTSGESLVAQGVYSSIASGKLQHDVAAVQASQASIVRHQAVLAAQEVVAQRNFTVAKSAHYRSVGIANSYGHTLDALNRELAHVKASLRPKIVHAVVPASAGTGGGDVSAGAADAAVASGKIVFPIQNSAIVLSSGYWSLDDGVDIGTVNNACGPAAIEVAIGPGVVVGKGINGFGPDAPIIHITGGPLVGRYVYYGNALPALVSIGQVVAAGQPVAEVGCGSVGYSTAPHLEIGVGPGSADALPYRYQTSPLMLKLLLAAV
jgi:murein DD-endopeptidase MepM/ murein hydrolase activator NlpD